MTNTTERVAQIVEMLQQRGKSVAPVNAPDGTPTMDPNAELDERAAALLESLQREREEAQAALRHARPLLAECSSDYNHPNFTDRHGTGPRLKAALKVVDTVLDRAAPAGREEGT